MFFDLSNEITSNKDVVQQRQIKQVDEIVSANFLTSLTREEGIRNIRIKPQTFIVNAAPGMCMQNRQFVESNKIIGM